MSEGISNKVAIVGMGCTKFGERWEASAEDLMIEAFVECLEDAGIEVLVYDGAEIHESVIILLAIDRLGAEAVICAPDRPQPRYEPESSVRTHRTPSEPRRRSRRPRGSSS